MNSTKRLLELSKPFLSKKTYETLAKGNLAQALHIGKHPRDERDSLITEIQKNINQYKERNPKLAAYEVEQLKKIDQEIKNIVGLLESVQNIKDAKQSKEIKSQIEPALEKITKLIQLTQPYVSEKTIEDWNRIHELLDRNPEMANHLLIKLLYFGKRKMDKKTNIVVEMRKTIEQGKPGTSFDKAQKDLSEAELLFAKLDVEYGYKEKK